VAAGYDKPALWSRWLKDSLPDLVLNAMLLLGTLLMGIIVFRQVRMNVRNQTELAELRDELTSINHTLQLMALADGLTGLANRRQFDLFLNQSLKASSLSKKPVSLVMLDIDFLNAITTSMAMWRAITACARWAKSSRNSNCVMPI
jgi:predicted signal transduction protein with EAL and GGDEF domain